MNATRGNHVSVLESRPHNTYAHSAFAVTVQADMDSPAITEARRSRIIAVLLGARSVRSLGVDGADHRALRRPDFSLGRNTLPCVIDFSSPLLVAWIEHVEQLVDEALDRQP